MTISVGDIALAVEPEHLAQLQAILAQHAAGRLAWAYGSRVRSPAQTRPLKPFSDLDIALAGEPMSLFEMADLRDALSESALPFRVDITQKTALPAAWRVDFCVLN